jgi:hypothetical protein
MEQNRTERDTFGTIEVPADRLWGAQTQRALEHFAISTERMPDELIKERWLRSLRQRFWFLSGKSAAKVKGYPRARVLLFNQARAHAPVGNPDYHQAACT